MEGLISFETAKLAKEKGFTFKDCSEYITHVFKSNGDEWKLQYQWSLNGNCVSITNEDMFFLGKSCNYPRPTQSLLQKWLRENYKLYIEIYLGNNILEKKQNFSFLILKANNMVIEHKNNNTIPYNTYEEALEVGLQYTLKLI